MTLIPVLPGAGRGPGFKQVVGMRWWRAGFGVAVLAVTTGLALLPGDAWPLATLAQAGARAGLQPYLPALTHLLGFAGLVGVFTALGGHPRLAAAGVLGYSALLELLQGFIPWREASWADMQVNLLAVVLGLGVGLGVTRGGRAGRRRRPLRIRVVVAKEE